MTDSYFNNLWTAKKFSLNLQKANILKVYWSKNYGSVSWEYFQEI